MGYAKILKTRQYFKRYQTKFRRRRESKTDYYARKRLVNQDANKYGTPKYRLVVRFSNKNVITQIVHATLEGDHVLCEAQSTELTKWGLPKGNKSYPASYATGLLLARRLLNKIGLDKMYTGASEVNGDDYNVAALAETYAKDRRPFKAILDIGLTNSTTGNRVYAVLKGACDGGIHIPHNTKKFFGSEKDEETKKVTYHPEANRDRIFGCHIDEYMNLLKEKSQADFDKQFGAWAKALKAAGVKTVEELFGKIHSSIRANPARPPVKVYKKTPQTYEDKEKTLIKTKNGTYKKFRKLTLEQRKANVQKKIQAALKKMSEAEGL